MKQEMKERIRGLEIGIHNLQIALDLHHYEALKLIIRDMRWDLSELKKTQGEMNDG